MDLSSILRDQELVESSTDLSSKDILKRCENLVRSKVKKSHSLGDLYGDSSSGGNTSIGYSTDGEMGNSSSGQQNSTGTGAIRIPERPRPYHHSHSSHAITRDRERERGATPMSL
jgi:hypothetical protein